MTLTDGGVYDNLGANPLFRERNQVSYAIVSDAGKPFQIDDQPTESGAVVLTEAIGILMEQVRGLQFKRLELANQATNEFKPLWFSIDSAKGQSQDGDSDFASSIGTNLKRLSEAEMAVLKRHGGSLLVSRLKRYAEDLLGAA